MQKSGDGPRTGQDRTGQDRTGQDRTGQDQMGRDMTGKNDKITSPQGEKNISENDTFKNRDRTGPDGQGRTRQDSRNPKIQKFKKISKNPSLGKMTKYEKCYQELAMKDLMHRFRVWSLVKSL